MKSLLIVAAENAALPVMRLGEREISGRASEVGDTVCDSAHALAETGCEVTVVTPAYGGFHRMPGARQVARLKVGFADKSETVFVYEVLGRPDRDLTRNLVLEHPLFSSGGPGRIYCDQPGSRVLGVDARRFALFCTAVAEATVQNAFGNFDTVHLHDWPSAFVLMLRRFHRAFRVLRNQRYVYSLYDLYRNARCSFASGADSLEHCFPGLGYNRAQVADPERTDCANLAAAALRLADAVHLPSPSYVREVLTIDHPLHTDLRRAADEGRLKGVLGGCDYPTAPLSVVENWEELIALMRARVMRWTAATATMASSQFIAYQRLAGLRSERPKVLLTSVSAIDDSAMAIYRQRASDGRPALCSLLERLNGVGLFLLMGKGDARHEQFLADASARYDNLVFLNGTSGALEQALYASGDLFVKANQFEPAAGAHLYALRAGQPCLAHDTGAISDTLNDGGNAFLFGGDTMAQRADALVATLERALLQFEKHPVEWLRLRRAAAATRVEWSQTATALIDKVYSVPVVEI